MTQRTERLSKFIQREVSEIIRKKVDDPRIGFVSLTDVEVSEDLKAVKIFVSVFGDQKKKKDAMAGLRSATHYIRGELAPRLDLRTLPGLIFVLDNSLERGSNVIALMEKLEKEDSAVISRKKKVRS